MKSGAMAKHPALGSKWALVVLGLTLSLCCVFRSLRSGPNPVLCSSEAR